MSKLKEILEMSKQIKYGFPSSDQTITFCEMKVVYDQKCDTSDNIQSLTIEAIDQGGGWYFVINTKRWAFDDIDELIKVLEDFKKRIEL